MDSSFNVTWDLISDEPGRAAAVRSTHLSHDELHLNTQRGRVTSLLRDAELELPILF